MKSAILISLFAVLAVGCGHKQNSSANAFPQAEGLQAFCANPVSVAVRPGETIVPSLGSPTGRWQLESLRTYMQTNDEDGETGYLVGEVSNGDARVTCHNGYRKNADNYRNLSSNIGLPSDIDTDRGIYTSEISLQLETRDGRTTASSQITSVYKMIPKTSSEGLLGDVSGILVKTPEGKLVLRFRYGAKIGGGSQNYSAEATYKPVR